jgi:hypothetical protein
MRVKRNTEDNMADTNEMLLTLQYGVSEFRNLCIFILINHITATQSDDTITRFYLGP